MTSPHLIPGSAHFQVIEEPAYLPSGSGEHLYVDIEKEGLTTDQVAEALAKACGKRDRDIGYAGRKDRHAVTMKLGAFKTSMLQDVEAGKAVELDALVTAVKELGSLTNVPTPYTDALLGLARLQARVRGLY